MPARCTGAVPTRFGAVLPSAVISVTHSVLLRIVAMTWHGLFRIAATILRWMGVTSFQAAQLFGPARSLRSSAPSFPSHAWLRLSMTTTPYPARAASSMAAAYSLGEKVLSSHTSKSQSKPDGPTRPQYLLAEPDSESMTATRGALPSGPAMLAASAKAHSRAV